MVPSTLLDPPVAESRQDVSTQTIQAAREALQRHLQFGSELIRQSFWGPEVQAEARQEFRAIQRRKKEPKLFLGVFGEFSTGKSTLINALVRDELLAMDVLQATTCSLTHIEHGWKRDAEVEFSDGRRLSFRASRLAWWERIGYTFLPPVERWRRRLDAFIHEHTAQDATARQVHHVKIRHPGRTLRQGLVLVDTPGINPDGNNRHMEVAVEAIESVCDAAIVVIRGTEPASVVLLDFLRDHLGHILHRCVFVVTWMDRIQPRDRERVLSSVRSRLQSRLGVKDPLVVGSAPLIALEDALGRKGNEEDRAFVVSFHEMETKLMAFLQRGRAIVLLERLFTALSNLWEKQRGQLDAMIGEYTQREECLRRGWIPDLGSFVAACKREHENQLRSEAKNVLHRVISVVEAHRGRLNDVVGRQISAIDGKGALKRYLQDGFREMLKDMQPHLEQELKGLVGKLYELSAQQHLRFEQEFQEMYKSLRALGDAMVLPPTHLARLGLTMPAGLSSMPAGMVLTIGDGVLKWIKSLFSGPSLGELKKQARVHCESKTQEYCTYARSSLTSSLEGQINVAWAALSQSMDKYFFAYAKAVDRMIAKLQAEKEVLDSKRAVAEGRLKVLSDHLQAIEQTRQELRVIR